VDDATANDLRFIANAEDSIRLYQAFIERAGEQPHFADALERSRERIADLKAEIVFVEQGIHARLVSEPQK
jgi:hypothetical protein